jgi:rubrerythrin
MEGSIWAGTERKHAKEKKLKIGKMATSDASGSSLLPVVAGGLPEEVEVRLVDPSAAASKQDEDKGRGAFSLRCFSARAAVMKELPYVAVQDVSNRHRAWTCSHCFTFLQSLEAQFNWHRKQTEAILGYSLQPFQPPSRAVICD